MRVQRGVQGERWGEETAWHGRTENKVMEMEMDMESESE